FLAGLPQRPSVYSPFFGKSDDEGVPYWKSRGRGVIDRMKEQGYITEVVHQEALSELESLEFEKTVTNIKAPHFVFYVRDELAEMFGEEVVESGGLQVTTTLDIALHEVAEQIVNEEVTAITNLNIT